jgi:DNA-binding PucR family transcriptional regulator
VAVRLSALVETSDGGLVPVGPLAADPRIDAVITTDLLDPRRYLNGGELVLTGLAWWQPDRPGRSRGFVAALVGGGAVALAAGDAELGSIPDDLVEACAEAGLPLLRVPVAYSFAAVTDRALRHLSGRDDLGAVLARHRALIAAVAAREVHGSGLDGVLGLVGADLDLRCWVLSPAGRQLAGVSPLEDRERRTLARQFLRAPRFPHVLQRPDDRTVSLLGAGAPTSRAASWILVVAEDHTTWSAERRTVVEELVSLVALEADLSRRRSDAERQLVAALTGTSAAEVERCLRQCGLDATLPCVVVASAGPMSAVVLTETLSAAGPAVEGGSSAWAFGEVDGEVIAVLHDHGDLVGRLRAVIETLKPGLGPEPLRLGVSDRVTGGAALLGALAEARAAALTADASTPHSVAGPDQLSSHALLLAAVPVELRQAYRARVLGPLLEHDRLHRTELVRTLRTYLDSSGSWSRCAAEMHLHVNTLRYRIDRIETLTGRDLRRLQDQTDLLLALNLP